MKLIKEKRKPFLLLEGFKIPGWKREKDHPTSYLSNRIQFTNEERDEIIFPENFDFYRNFYDLFKNLEKNKLLPQIRLCIDYIYTSRESPVILSQIPFPFTSVEFGLVDNAIITIFTTIDDSTNPIGENNILWAAEYYFKSLSQTPHDSDINVFFQKNDSFDFVSIAVEIKDTTSSTIDEAFHCALTRLNRFIKKANYTLNGLTKFSNIIDLWEDYYNDKNEGFWQQAFKQNSWVLSLALTQPVILFQKEAYLGGKNISNQKGKIIDFIYSNSLSNNIALVEIKTPQTKIFKSAYRDTFSFTDELSGAINQLLHYRDTVLKEYNSLVRDSDFLLFNPKSILIIGSLKSMSIREKQTFELFRNELKSIDILTFDELFEKVFMTLNLIEKN